jgi:hypothetical protein
VPEFRERFMKKVHIAIGILLFIVFVVTGRLMRVDFPDKGEIPQDFRILMRSRHIYILLSGLLHLILGAYLQLDAFRRVRIAQFAASFILTISSSLFVAAFFLETYTYRHFSNVSRYAIYSALAGVALHLLAAIVPPATE